jgi:hypothetical protein
MTQSTRIKKHPHSRLINAISCMLIFGAIGSIILFNSHADSTCTISTELVNSCRPWVGGVASNYPQVSSDIESQIEYQEQRQGRQDDIVHTYHAVGSNSLSAADIYFATRANTMLYTNWKPTPNWGDIANQNAGIDSMAASVKSLGSTKIFMTIWHEPENDVSPGGDPNCLNVNYKGSAGTVAQYKAMWAYVENRFAADGVTNVVWAMDYMNYPPWNCLIPDLYPGDQYVNWITFNAYDSGTTESFDDNISNIYNILTNDSSSSQNFLSKPWGIVESGISGESVSAEETFYDQEKAALDNNMFPKLKMYMIYDSQDQGSSTGTNYRVGYDDNGTVDTPKGQHYYTFVSDPRFTDAYYQTIAPAPSPITDTTPPTVNLINPLNNAIVNGAITISGSASDNVGVTKVGLYIDNKLISTATTAPYDFAVNTALYTNGTHSVYLQAFDAAGNTAITPTVLLTVSNLTSLISTSTSDNSGSDTASINQPTTSTTIPVSGNLSFQPTVAGGPVTVTVDGKGIPGRSVNTAKLSNGIHTIRVTENGRTVTKRITVHNSLPDTLRNDLLAHELITTTAAALIVVAVIAYWQFWRLVLSKRMMLNTKDSVIIKPKITE